MCTCPVWNPYLVKHIHSIESIQRRATQLICGSDKPYSERLIELNWSSLEPRRKYLGLLQLYKIIHGYSDIDYRPNMWISLAQQELEVTMTLKLGLKQQGQTILNFHFLTVTLMTGTLYLTQLCLLLA